MKAPIITIWDDEYTVRGSKVAITNQAIHAEGPSGATLEQLNHPVDKDGHFTDSFTYSGDFPARRVWNPGTIKAGKTSEDTGKNITVRIYNNLGGHLNEIGDKDNQVAQMIECSVTALDSKGVNNEDIAKNKWIEVCVNEEQKMKETIYTANGKDFPSVVTIGTAGSDNMWADSTFELTYNSDRTAVIMDSTGTKPLTQNLWFPIGNNKSAMISNMTKTYVSQYRDNDITGSEFPVGKIADDDERQENCTISAYPFKQSIIDNATEAVLASAGTKTAKDAMADAGATGSDPELYDSSEYDDKNQYAKCEFRVNVPSNAKPAANGFKIRVQGYYTG